MLEKKLGHGYYSVMVQFYFLSILYLVLAACLLLVDKYGSTFLFLINFKTFYNSKRMIQVISLILGALIATSIVVWPVAPGPVVLGDILPAINIIVLVLYFFRQMGREQSVADFNNGKRNALGFVTLGVALVHFLFPGVVIV